MKKPPHFLILFTLCLLALLGVGFIIHSQLRQASGLEPYGDLLIRSYWINALLAFAIVFLLYFLRKRARNLIGFMFIGGSLLKFAIFFIFFYPPFQADDALSRSEFGSFFIPYALALLLETFFTSKMLRILEKQDQG